MKSTLSSVSMLLFVYICGICASLNYCPDSEEGKPYQFNKTVHIDGNIRDIAWSITYPNGTSKQISHCYHDVEFCYDFTWEFTPTRLLGDGFYTNILHISKVLPEHQGMVINILEINRSTGATYLVYSCTLVVHAAHTDWGNVEKLPRPLARMGTGTVNRGLKSSKVGHGSGQDEIPSRHARLQRSTRRILWSTTVSNVKDVTTVNVTDTAGAKVKDNPNVNVKNATTPNIKETSDEAKSHNEIIIELFIILLCVIVLISLLCLQYYACKRNKNKHPCPMVPPANDRSSVVLLVQPNPVAAFYSRSYERPLTL